RTPAAHQKAGANQIAVDLAYRVVVNVQVSGKSAHAGQEVGALQFFGSDEQLNLGCELLPDGSLAFLIDLNIHASPTLTNCDTTGTVTPALAYAPGYRYRQMVTLMSASPNAAAGCSAGERKQCRTRPTMC